MGLVVLPALKKFTLFLLSVVVDWVFVKMNLKFSEVGVFYLLVPQTFPVVFILDCFCQLVYLDFFLIT